MIVYHLTADHADTHCHRRGRSFRGKSCLHFLRTFEVMSWDLYKGYFARLCQLIALITHDTGTAGRIKITPMSKQRLFFYQLNLTGVLYLTLCRFGFWAEGVPDMSSKKRKCKINPSLGANPRPVDVRAKSRLITSAAFCGFGAFSFRPSSGRVGALCPHASANGIASSEDRLSLHREMGNRYR
ncbi:hypothetical protein J6590_012044 [Homalodisca vitripennis]|nr:hypothetical protein J6590_012044 [Homalodisca vitripennis]